MRECDVQNVAIHYSPLQNHLFRHCTVDGGIQQGHTGGWFAVTSSIVKEKGSIGADRSWISVEFRALRHVACVIVQVGAFIRKRVH